MRPRLLAVLVGVVASLGGGAATASAADLYLSPSGTNEGDCRSESSPCSSVGYAANVVASGDVVHLAARTYAVGLTVAVTTPNVTWVGPQAGVRAYGRSGPEATIRSFGSDLMSLAPTAGGAVFDGLHFTGPYDAALRAAASVTVRNARFDGYGLGVQAQGDLLLERSLLRPSAPVGGLGVDASGSGSVVERNHFLGLGSGLRAPSGSGILTATGNAFLNRGVAIQTDAQSSEIHGNRFYDPPAFGGTPSTVPLVIAGGAVDAEDNWWGCNAGPGACGRPLGTGAIDANPWLTLSAATGASNVPPGGSTSLSASLSRNSDGVVTGYGAFPDVEAAFASDAGWLEPELAPLDPAAETTLFAPSSGDLLDWEVFVDGQQISGQVGIGVPAAIVDPTGLDFAGVVRGTTSAPQTVTVTNSGSGVLQVDRLRGAGTGNSLFDVVDDECTGSAVPAGGSCTFGVVFAPTGTGVWTPKLQVLGNVPTVSVRLSGSAVDPLTITPGELELRAVRGASATQALTITNNASSALAINGVTIGGTGKSLFAVTGSTCGSSLPGGASCTVEVRFSPVAVGAWSPTVTVRTGAGPFVVPTEGVGLPVWDVTPGSHDFGSVARGSLRSQTFTVVNNGAMTSGVSFEKVGTGKSLFAIDPGDCPSGLLGSGVSCEFTVTFAPQAAGSWTPTLTVRTGHGGKAIALAGQGT